MSRGLHAFFAFVLLHAGDALPMRTRARALHDTSAAGAAAVSPLVLSAYAGTTVLFVVAHPDDIETVAGGTAALLRAQGTSVVYVVTTNGDTGWHKDNSTAQQQVAAIRFSEQLSAAAVFAIPPELVLQLNYPDGQLQDASEVAVRGRIIAAIRTYRPAAVFTWSPYLDFSAYQWGLEHTDHHTTGKITLDAVYPSARDFLSWPEQTAAGLAPWIVPDVYLFQFSDLSPAASVYVDIGTVITTKISSLLKHVSQYSNATDVAQDIYSLGAMVAGALGVASVTYAEAFLHVPMLP